MIKHHQKNLRIAPVAFFILCALICLVLLVTTTGKVTDSDAASELMLGKLMAHDGHLSPFSTDWYYSTELTVLNNHLIYSFLFHLTDSYYWVRVLGAVILCTLLVLSFYVLTWGAGLSSTMFFLGAGYLLLPVSVSYARIVLMHQYYTVHLMRTFVISGLILRLYREPRNRREGLIIASLLVASFFAGISGLRQLAVTGIPLAMASFYRFLFKEKIRKADGWLLLSLIVMALGYLVNSQVLSKMYHFASFDVTTLKEFHWRNLFDGFYFVIELCGYRPGVRAISLLGVASVAGFFSAFILLFGTYRACCEKDLTDEPAKTILSRFFMAALIAMQVTGHLMYGVAYSMYYIPVVVFALPSFFAFAQRQKEPVFAHKVLLTLVMLSMLLNGVLTTHWLGFKRDDSIRYGGLDFQNVHIVQELEGATKFLDENDVYQGYATYWNSNVLNEMSNGKMTPLTININSNGDITWANWLTSPSFRRKQSDTAYLLLDKNEEKIMQEKLSTLTPVAQYEDELYSVYIYPWEVLSSLLSSPQ